MVELLIYVCDAVLSLSIWCTAVYVCECGRGVYVWELWHDNWLFAVVMEMLINLAQHDLQRLRTRHTVMKQRLHAKQAVRPIIQHTLWHHFLSGVNHQGQIQTIFFWSMSSFFLKDISYDIFYRHTSCEATEVTTGIAPGNQSVP